MKKFIFIKYSFLFCIIFSSCVFYQTAHSSIKEDIEKELISTKYCTATKAKIFLESLENLNQSEISEALRISDSTLSQFLNHDQFGLKVCHHLTWYYTNIKTPLSALRTFDVEGYDSVEEIFWDSKKYIILPQRLKNRDEISTYLLSLVREEREESIKIISDTLPIKTELLQKFLDGDKTKFRSIYVAIRNYYRSERAEKLSQLIERKINQRELPWSLMETLSRLSFGGGYKQLKSN